MKAGIGPDAPAGSAPSMFMILAHDHPDLAWNRMLQYSALPDSSADPQMLMLLVPYIASSSSDPRRAVDLQTYADQHIAASARQSVEAAIATIKLNAKFRVERLPEIDKWLASTGAR
jgi:hypothetical protein